MFCDQWLSLSSWLWWSNVQTRLCEHGLNRIVANMETLLHVWYIWTQVLDDSLAIQLHVILFLFFLATINLTKLAFTDLMKNTALSAFVALAFATEAQCVRIVRLVRSSVWDVVEQPGSSRMFDLECIKKLIKMISSHGTWKKINTHTHTHGKFWKSFALIGGSSCSKASVLSSLLLYQTFLF